MSREIVTTRFLAVEVPYISFIIVGISVWTVKFPYKVGMYIRKYRILMSASAFGRVFKW